MDKKGPGSLRALGSFEGYVRPSSIDFMPPTETREITPYVCVHPDEER
jgi:hypothetical protein